MARSPADPPDPRRISQKIAKIVPDLDDVEENPEAYIRGIHKRWKDLGETHLGKPRHSDRYLAEQLKEHDIVVRSLTPKLVGKTRIRPEEGTNLVRFFLSNWPQPGPEGSEDISYAEAIPAAEIEVAANFVGECLEAVTDIRDDALPVEAPRPDPGSTLPGEDVAAVIVSRFEECDAMFTVATEVAFVQTGRGVQFIGFRNLMNDLKAIEDSDGKARPLVWILDYGLRKFEDQEARLRFMNVQTLMTRFKALRTFEDRGSRSRWEWLNSRAAFVVIDTLHDEPLDLRGVRRPSFVPHHVCFSEIAANWAQSPDFRTLYGSELERVDQRTFTVFFRADGWLKEPAEWTLGDGVRYDPGIPLAHRRYFGYATFAKDNRPNADRIGRGLELPVPQAGGSYGEAYRTVYAAATELLGIENRSRETPFVSGPQALAQLRFLGFRILKLEDFMQL